MYVLGRGQERGYIRVECHQIRDYTVNKQKQVDNYPYGGGRGAVMQADPLYRCWEHFPPPLVHLGVVARQKNGGHRPAVPHLGPGVLGGLQHPVPVALVLVAPGRPGQKPCR